VGIATPLERKNAMDKFLETYPYKNKPFVHQQAYLMRFWEKRVAAIFSEMGTGKSRLEVARELGIRFRVAANLRIDDGIDVGGVLVGIGVGVPVGRTNGVPVGVAVGLIDGV
jgi:hypothetical protein